MSITDPIAAALDNEFQRQAGNLSAALERAAATVRRLAGDVAPSHVDGLPDYSAKLAEILRAVAEVQPRADLFGLMQAAADADRYARRHGTEKE